MDPGVCVVVLDPGVCVVVFQTPVEMSPVISFMPFLNWLVNSSPK